MWQAWAFAAAAAGAGTVLHIQRMKRLRRQARAKARKLAELSKAGFVFSKEYDIGPCMLMVDKPNRQWALMDYENPAAAMPRPLDAIEQVRIVSKQKVHQGLRSIHGAALLRRGVSGESNHLVTATDTMRGVEVVLGGKSKGQVLYIDCMDGDYSAERVQVILETLMEQARYGQPE